MHQGVKPLERLFGESALLSCLLLKQLTGFMKE
jgi:hypothetical protein